jgi:hypothetical protein
MINLDPKVIKTASNKHIYIYDDLFSFSEQVLFKKFVNKSLFSTTGFDGIYDTDGQKAGNQIFSHFSDDDVNNMGFTSTNGYAYLNNKYQFTQRRIKQIRVNLSNFFEKSIAHTDCQELSIDKGLTLVYHVNLKWDMFWGGWTTFLSEDLSEIEYSCAFKTGRIVLFDGTIPHFISPISTSCNEHRYSFVIQYGKIENNCE